MSQALQNMVSGLVGSAPIHTEDIVFTSKRVSLKITYYQFEGLYYGGITFQQHGNQVGWSAISADSPNHKYDQGFSTFSEMIKDCIKLPFSYCEDSFRDYPFTRKYKKDFDKMIAYFESYQSPEP